MQNYSFQNHPIMYRKSSMKKGIFTILSNLSGDNFSVTNFFVFRFSHWKTFNNIYVMKEYKKTIFFYNYLKKKKKKLLDC